MGTDRVANARAAAEAVAREVVKILYGHAAQALDLEYHRAFDTDYVACVLVQHAAEAVAREQEILKGKVGASCKQALTKYRKRSVGVEAVRHLGTNWPEVYDFLVQGQSANVTGHCLNVDSSLEIVTLEGVMRAEVGDWIIKGVKGEIYLIKDDIFCATYEVVGRCERM